MKKLIRLQRHQGQHWVGDGFPVYSIFSYQDLAAMLSPFLLLDYAAPSIFPPSRKKLGVGPHPHRGFETVTIVYAGGVSHRDSSGGGGDIAAGDVQWMTAAAGIIHEEYHSPAYARQGGPMEMIQLWVNLPAALKMSAPRYQSLSAASIPCVELEAQAGRLRLIAGQYGELCGPAQTQTAMNVWDLQLHAGQRLSLDLPDGFTCALFVLDGELACAGAMIKTQELAVFERAGARLQLDIQRDTRALLLNGAPIDEPIAAYGPFVMNTREEIMQAIDDYQQGRFAQIQP